MYVLLLTSMVLRAIRQFLFRYLYGELQTQNRRITTKKNLQRNAIHARARVFLWISINKLCGASVFFICQQRPRYQLLQRLFFFCLFAVEWPLPCPATAHTTTHMKWRAILLHFSTAFINSKMYYRNAYLPLWPYSTRDDSFKDEWKSKKTAKQRRAPIRIPCVPCWVPRTRLTSEDRSMCTRDPWRHVWTISYFYWLKQRWIGRCTTVDF